MLMIYHAPSRFSDMLLLSFRHTSSRFRPSRKSSGMSLGASSACESLEQLSLLCGEMHRQHNFDAGVEVAAALFAHPRHAFSCQAEAATILCLRWNGEHQFAPIRGWHLNGAAKHGRH